MAGSASDPFRPLRAAVLRMVFALSVVACGEIAQVATGTATLTWTAVNTNTDGTALRDLGGYRISYGRSPSAMGHVVVVADPARTTYVVSHLSHGTWYFAVAAYTRKGENGRLSNPVSKIIK